MNIRVDSSYLEEQPLCYAVVFDTGYFYIGATKRFNARVSQHKAAIKKYPERYLIGIKHEPKSCIIVKLLLSSVKDEIFRLERDLLVFHSKNKKLINAHKCNFMVDYSANKIKESIKKLNK